MYDDDDNDCPYARLPIYLPTYLPTHCTLLCCTRTTTGVCRTELGRYLLDPSVVKNIPPYLMPLLGVVGSPIGRDGCSSSEVLVSTDV